MALIPAALFLLALPWGAAQTAEAAPLEGQVVPRSLQGQPVPKVPLWLDPAKQTGVANCVVDIGVATLQLAQAGLGINHAVTRCGTEIDQNGNPMLVKTDEEKRACAATVVGITASFQFAAFFMSSAALDCGKTFALVDERAMNKLQCAADVQLLLASLTLIASAGTAVGDACKDESDRPRRLQEDAHFTDQLQNLAAQNATSVRRDLLYVSPLDSNDRSGQPVTGKERQVEIAECVFDVAQIVLLFSRAGLFINAAVHDCSAMSINHGPEKNKAKCAADIGNMIAAFAFAGAGIAASIAHCPEWKQGTEPICAGAILSLIAGTAKVQAAATSMAIDCTPDMVGDKGIAGQPLAADYPQSPLAACAAHTKCSALTGDCCPTKDGQMLKCCQGTRRLGSNVSASIPDAEFV